MSAEYVRIEREQTNPDLRRAVHRARQAWHATHGMIFDRDYYKTQHRFLDTHLAQLRFSTEY